MDNKEIFSNIYEIKSVSGNSEKSSISFKKSTIIFEKNNKENSIENKSIDNKKENNDIFSQNNEQKNLEKTINKNDNSSINENDDLSKIENNIYYKQKEKKKFLNNPYTIKKRCLYSNSSVDSEKDDKLSDSFKDFEIKIEEERNIIDILIVNNESFFNDENNYILPNLEIMEDYPLILINFDMEKIKNENYIDIEKERTKFYNLVIKKYFNFEIKNYLQKKMNLISNLDKFINFIFDLHQNLNYYSIIPEQENEIENEEKKEQEENNDNLIKISSIGKIKHFSNLFYKYKKEKKNSEKDEEDDMDFYNDLFLKASSNQHYISINIESSKQPVKLIKNIIEEDILFYRDVLNDGNSFFRSFIFKLIESCILRGKNSINIIIKLIKLMKIIIEKYEEKFEKKKNYYFLVLLKLEDVVNYIKNNMIVKALELFYSSYNSDFFDECIINYLKFILYFSKKKDIKLFNFEEIDFELYDLILLPLIFNITLEVSFDIKIKKNNFLYFNLGSSERKKVVVQLIFYKNNAFICYNQRDYLYLLKQNLIEKYEQIPKIRKLIYEFKKKEFCKNCKQETIHIALIKKQKRVCRNCLNILKEKQIQHIVETLSKSLWPKDKIYKKFEVQTNSSSIYLKGSEYFHLFNEFFIDSIQKSFLSYINEYKIWFCKKCQKYVENTRKYKCGCTYCQNCLSLFIKKMTNGYMILTPYEKKHIGKIRCLCGNNLDISSIINEEEIFSEDKEKYYFMIKRLNESIKLLCMNCEIKIFNRQDNNGNNNNHQQIELIDQINQKITENHVLCKKCYEILKIKWVKKIEIFCKICYENHSIKGKGN